MPLRTAPSPSERASSLQCPFSGYLFRERLFRMRACLFRVSLQREYMSLQIEWLFEGSGGGTIGTGRLIGRVG
eukprot:647948-Rhodomonas_salina.1